jgi:hypothetical protein
MRERQRLYTIFLIIAAVLGLWAFVAPIGRRAESLYFVDTLSAITGFFVLGAVVRTIKPEFRFTFGRVVVAILLMISVVLAVEIGFALLIVPGVWLLGKFALALPAYLLGLEPNPYSASWRLTTGQFWETLGVIVLTIVSVGLASFVLSLIAGLIIALLPIFALLLAPALLYAMIFFQYVAALAQMRWTVRMCEREEALPLVRPA